MPWSRAVVYACLVTTVLCAVFFVSGAAALLFQTLFFRHAGLMLGNGVWATAVVTASFMGGLAAGNAWAARRGEAVRSPLRFYAGLELAVALSGIALLVLIPVLTPLAARVFAPALDRPLLLNALRLALAFGLLLFPASAMGATLPLLARALSRLDANFGCVLGRLYGWNTLGAVAGALLGEVVLVERFGLLGTGLVAGALNGIAALAALLLARRSEGEAPQSPAPKALSGAHPAGGARLLAAAFFAGALLLALEGIWFRTLQLFVIGTSLSFAVMLAVVLLGIGLGGLGASLVLRTGLSTGLLVPAAALLAGSLTAWTYAALPEGLSGFGGHALAEPSEFFVLGMRLMFPTSLVSGALFTFLGAALRSAGRAEAAAAGALTLANTLGAMLGALVSGLLLLPALGIENSLFVLSAGYLGVALFGLRGLDAAAARARWALGGAALLFASVIGLFPFGLMRNALQPLSAGQWRREGVRMQVRREGLTETVVYLVRELLGQPVYHRLVTNSFSMSGTHVASARYMGAFVYWPVALHPAPKRALLISYGVGVTARSLTDTRALDHIDVVDISRDILELGRLIFPDRFPLDDPRVRVHVEDGRFFLLSGAGLYDIITGEPPPPKNAGIGSLYSAEYFRLLRSRLAPGGIASYWLPVYQLHVGEARAITRGFCDAFEDCSLWTGAGLEWMLAGTAGQRGPVPEERLARQWSDPVVGPRLREVGFEAPEWLGSTFIGDAAFLRQWTAGVPPLDDDFPLRLSSRLVGYTDPEYVRLLDPAGRRERFLKSPLVAALWPAPLRERTAAAFDTQRVLDQVYAFATGMRPLNQGEALALLEGTRLRTPVLHAFLASEREVRIAKETASRGLREPIIDEMLTIDALADRDYRRAEEHVLRISDAEHRARRTESLRALVQRLALTHGS